MVCGGDTGDVSTPMAYFSKTILHSKEMYYVRSSSNTGFLSEGGGDFIYNKRNIITDLLY